MDLATRKDLRPLQGLAILVIEDHPDSLDAMCLVLNSFGARALAARDGQQALATLEKTAVDVILCDLRLPGMDGFEVCACVRREPRWHRIAIIAITGMTSAAEYGRILTAGFDGYLAKPVDADIIPVTVEKIVSARLHPPR